MFACFFDFVVAAHSSAGDVVQFCLYQLFAYRRDAVNVEDSVEVVVFVLDDSREESLKHLLVLHDLFIYTVSRCSDKRPTTWMKNIPT